MTSVALDLVFQELVSGGDFHGHWFPGFSVPGPDVILNVIDMVNQDKLFTMSHNIGTGGHQFKIYKNRYRLNVRGNYFSNRVIDLWNELPENTVMAPTLNNFKSRLNKCWYGHPRKFDPWCYIPGKRTRQQPTYQIHQQRL